MLLLAELAVPEPLILVAFTVNVYVVPAVNPLTVIIPEPAPLSVPVIFPGELVAV
jgi:hypothetical protein